MGPVWFERNSLEIKNQYLRYASQRNKIDTMLFLNVSSLVMKDWSSAIPSIENNRCPSINQYKQHWKLNCIKKKICQIDEITSVLCILSWFQGTRRSNQMFNVNYCWNWIKQSKKNGQNNRALVFYQDNARPHIPFGTAWKSIRAWLGSDIAYSM